jgi:hypothetical protein
MTSKKNEQTTHTNLTEGDADTLSYIGYEGGPQTLFGMDKSDSFYQRDQTKAENEIARRKAELEAEELSAFRASSTARRAENAAKPLVAAKTFKMGEKEFKKPLNAPIKILSQKRRRVDGEESGAAKKTTITIKESGIVKQSTEDTVEKSVSTLFDYPSSEDES